MNPVQGNSSGWYIDRYTHVFDDAIAEQEAKVTAMIDKLDPTDPKQVVAVNAEVTKLNQLNGMAANLVREVKSMISMMLNNFR